MVRFIKRRYLIYSLTFLLMTVCGGTALAYNGVGELAENFTVTDYVTRDPISLYDYQGSVILIDFFRHW